MKWGRREWGEVGEERVVKWGGESGEVGKERVVKWGRREW